MKDEGGRMKAEERSSASILPYSRSSQSERKIINAYAVEGK